MLFNFFEGRGRLMMGRGFTVMILGLEGYYAYCKKVKREVSEERDVKVSVSP
jgi:hypothetical protein